MYFKDLRRILGTLRASNDWQLGAPLSSYDCKKYRFAKIISSTGAIISRIYMD